MSHNDNEVWVGLSEEQFKLRVKFNRLISMLESFDETCHRPDGTANAMEHLRMASEEMAQATILLETNRYEVAQ